MAEKTYDVAIVGGGIAGCASAYYLAKKGFSVILLEKGRLAGEQSGRNLGFVRQQGRDPLEIPLMMACNHLWQGLEAELEAEVEWRQGGMLFAADDEAAMADHESWLEQARNYGLDSCLLSSREVAALLPGPSREWLGGLYTSSDGQADPVKTTKAFASAAARLGVELRTGCIVEAIETAGGVVSGLHTETGHIAAGTVLLAAGVWTAPMLRSCGIDLPQLRVCSTVFRTKPTDPKTALCLWGSSFGFRQRSDGSLIISAGTRGDHEIGLDSLRYARTFQRSLGSRIGKVDLHFGRGLFADFAALVDQTRAVNRQMRAHRVLAPTPNVRKVQTCLATFREVFPGLGDVELATSWAGTIEVTPDEVPVLGEIPGLHGLIVASGFSGHGFGMGPITGTLIAELIADGRTSLDISGLRFSRFAKRPEVKSVTG